MGVDKSVFGKVGTWERHKAASNWSFDPSITTRDEFTPLCTFQGDWSAGFDCAVAECNEHSFKLDINQPEQADLQAASGKDVFSFLYEKDLYYVTGFDEHNNPIADKDTNIVYQPFFKMLESIGMYEPHVVRISTQRLGQVSPFHVDFLEQYVEPNQKFSKRYKEVAGDNHLKLRRVFVALNPYEYGHIWQLGNSFWKNYSAGECITFDWKNMPHGTANMGWTPRVNLQATGFVNEKFEQLVSAASNQIINLN